MIDPKDAATESTLLLITNAGELGNTQHDVDVLDTLRGSAFEKVIQGAGHHCDARELSSVYEQLSTREKLLAYPIAQWKVPKQNLRGSRKLL